MTNGEARLIDTNILIDLLRGKDEAIRWVDSLPNDERFIPVVTAAELLAGARDRHEQRIIEQELTLYQTLWINETISQTALEWYKQFRLSYGIGFLDCLTGATAHYYNLTLATLNEKHFAPFPAVNLERPYRL